MRAILLTGLILSNASIVSSAELTKEQQAVAMTILGEARGEGRMGMYAVACVLQARQADRQWSASLEKVCLQEWKGVHQFSCWNKKDPNRAKLPGLLKTHAQAPYAIWLAKHLTAGSKFDQKITGGSNHFATLNMKPYWAYKKVKVGNIWVRVYIKPTKIIGQHKFWKL
jgi:N-acetylmuramoyl-L-alanine amidase